MKCRLSQILPFSLMAVLLFVSFPITAHAVTLDKPDWGIDELSTYSDSNGDFSSFHSGYVSVDKSGAYYVDITLKVSVNRTQGRTKVLLNDASMYLAGTSIPAVRTYFNESDYAFHVTFQGPVEVYYPTAHCDFRFNWAYNTTNDSDFFTHDSSVSDDYTYRDITYSSFQIHAEPVAVAGSFGNRLNYLGVIGYLSGNQAVVDSIKNQSDRAHADSQAQQQLQKNANDLQQKTNENITKRAQEVESTMRDVGGHIATGYDNNRAGATKNKLGNSVSSMQDAESSIVDGAVSDLDSYTLPSTGILGYAVQFGQSFSLVGSMLQSIYVSAGSFNLIISVVFTLTITCMLLGIAKFFVR